MMGIRILHRLAAAGIALAVAAIPPAAVAAQLVLKGELRGAITPVTLEYVERSLDRAATERAEIIVFEMDTPGGLVVSTEDIIRAILASKVPVVVYVAPAGSQAASAGLYITNAADVAAMAPGTRIGAGHPVTVTGGSPGGAGGDDEKKGRDYLGEKIEHDMAAGVRSIAENRGRNPEVYERMVRESISCTEREALEQRVVDLVANDFDDLLRQLNGREIRRFDGTTRTLDLSDPRVDLAGMSLRQRILSWVANPQIAFLLLGIGMLGLYVEFNNPGLIAPGVVGVLALLLFAMSTQILPVNILGLFLIALAVALFVLEIKFASYGLLTVGGVLSLTLGFLTLFDLDEVPALKISLAFVLPTSLTVGLVMATVTLIAVKAQRSRVVTGKEGLVGEIGEVIADITAGGAGKVFVHGEYWDATSISPIERGRRVRVRAVRAMGLDVEPVEP